MNGGRDSHGFQSGCANGSAIIDGAPQNRKLPRDQAYWRDQRPLNRGRGGSAVVTISLDVAGY
jgi:hypothetical protein